MGAVFGSLSAICIGVSDLFGRKVVGASSALTAAAIMQIIAAGTSWASVLFVASAFDSGDFALGAWSGIGMAVGLACYYEGIARSSSTVVAPLVATLAALIPFVYTIVLGASPSILAIVGASIAIGGLVLVTIGGDSPEHVGAGLRWGLVSGLGYGFGLSVIINVASESGSWPAVSQRVAAFAALVAVARLSKLAVLPPSGVRLSGLGAGIFAGLTTVFYLLGIAIDAPVAVVTGSMFPAASVAVGWLFFRDPVSRLQVVGIAVVLAGVAGVVSG